MSVEKKADEKRETAEIIEKDSEREEAPFGESLASCSEVEWDTADPAYASELINVKKKPDKVTVFAAPSAKTIERTIIRTDTLSESLDENAEAIGRMASAIAHIFLSDKTIPSVNVSVNLQEVPSAPQTSTEPRTP
ncbi:unnamed protein product [Litomosoides sigmodontis]|uniref:Uncharacterized protein n=1 Tax=Litomosoides sigmodontis TaxID=42156 RepID=A0A3P6SQA8_LITSI|nr:unnamed protein product [Litomosoides sigmodontis]